MLSNRMLQLNKQIVNSPVIAGYQGEFEKRSNLICI